MKNKLRRLVNKLETMTEREKKFYLEKCYQSNEEAIDTILNVTPKSYKLP